MVDEISKEAISHTQAYQVARDGWTDADIERDRRYEEKIKSLETNIRDKLIDMEKATTAAFLASEKAIIKAEEAQRSYNERSNEFREALDDAVKNQISRPEADTRFGNVEEKINAIKKDVSDLRETRQGYVARESEIISRKSDTHWATSAIIAGISVIFGFIGLSISVIIAVTK